jgi:hypothetical protein
MATGHVSCVRRTDLALDAFFSLAEQGDVAKPCLPHFLTSYFIKALAALVHEQKLFIFLLFSNLCLQASSMQTVT